MLDKIGSEGGVRALLVFGSNPAVSAPRASHIEKRLDALDFLVVSDFFLSETAERADVVLPAAQWAEEEGTMTNVEGRVLLRKRATTPPRGVRTDLEILHALGTRLECGDRFPSEPREVFDGTTSRDVLVELPTMAGSPMTASNAKMAFSGRARAWSTLERPAFFWITLVTRMDARASMRVEFRPPKRRAGSRVSAVPDHRPYHRRNISREPRRAESPS